MPGAGRDPRGVRAGLRSADSVGEHAVSAALPSVRVPGPPASVAGVVDAESGAGTTDTVAVVIEPDQRLCDPTTRALGWGAQHGGVAGVADRSHRPMGGDAALFAATATGMRGPTVAGAADRAAHADAVTGPQPAADRADHLGTAIAAVAQIRLITDRVAGNGPLASTAPAGPAGATKPVVAQVTTGPPRHR